VDYRRVTLAVLLALGLGASLAWLQGRFDQSDLRKALELLEKSRPAGPGSASIDEAIARELGRPAECSSQITNGCRGIVQVRCGGPPGQEYLFDADLARRPPVLHPANPRAQALMVRLVGPGAPGHPIPVTAFDGGR
jgi:hypothetical protein